MNKTLVLAIFCCALTTGCARSGRLARVDPASVTTRASEQSGCPLTSQYNGDKKQSIDLDCYKFSPKDTETAYSLSTASRGEGDRNRFQNILINQANFACQLEKGRLYENRAKLDSALDFLSAGFSTASTIVGGELAKSILSGVAGLSTATRSNLNANIYQNQIIPAITLVMDAARKDILIELKARSSQKVNDYSSDEMIMLVNEYHRACSFERGVQLLLSAALNKEGADAVIRDINLRANANALARQIDLQVALKSRLESQKLDASGVQGTVDALQAKYQEIALKISENGQNTQTITTPSPSEGNTPVK